MTHKLFGAMILLFSVSLAHAQRSQRCAEGFQKKMNIETFVPVARGFQMYAHLEAHGKLRNSKDNPLVLMIHGAAANSQSYQPLAEKLYGLGHDILRVDMPGHGRSLMKNGIHGATFEQQGEYLARVLKYFGVEHVVIYAHSMGGGPAPFLAAKFDGDVQAMILDEPYAMPLEEYYYQNQDEMLSSRVSNGVKKIGKFQALGGLLLSCTPLGLTGLPQGMTAVGLANMGVGKVGNALTSVCAEIALPIAKNKIAGIVEGKIKKRPELYAVDGRLPATPEVMAAGTVAAFDPIEMKYVAPRVGRMPVVIMMGLKNAQVPRRLMEAYSATYHNARILTLDSDDLRGTTPHLHPIEASRIVAGTVDRIIRGLR